MKKLNIKTNKNDKPGIFVLLSILSFLPILLWPLIFFGTIFIFDNPKDMGEAYFLFFGINAYPLYLIANVILSYKKFETAPTFAYALLLWPIGLFLLILCWLFC